MTNRKNKDAVKRRDVKKRRKEIKRKTKIHSNVVRSIQTENISTKKLSELILKYAEPLTNAAGENEEEAIRLSVTLWNASLFQKQKALDIMELSLDDMANGDQLLKKEFYAIFEMMYNRKQNLFPADKRFIVDYFLAENDDGFYLQVASTTYKSHSNS